MVIKLLKAFYVPGIVPSAGIRQNGAVRVPDHNCYLTSHEKMCLHVIWAGQEIGRKCSPLGAGSPEINLNTVLYDSFESLLGKNLLRSPAVLEASTKEQRDQ